MYLNYCFQRIKKKKRNFNKKINYNNVLKNIKIIKEKQLNCYIYTF